MPREAMAGELAPGRTERTVKLMRGVSTVYLVQAAEGEHGHEATVLCSSRQPWGYRWSPGFSQSLWLYCPPHPVSVLLSLSGIHTQIEIISLRTLHDRITGRFLLISLCLSKVFQCMGHGKTERVRTRGSGARLPLATDNINHLQKGHSGSHSRAQRRNLCSLPGSGVSA